jgi:hypothetical protein
VSIRIPVSVPHRAAHVVAVHARQVAVEHEHVVAHDARLGQRRLPVARQVDRHPLPAQPARDRVGQPQLVFGDQHPHPVRMTDAA